MRGLHKTYDDVKSIEDLSFESFKISIKNTSAVLESFKNAQKIWNKKSAVYYLKCKAELYQIIYTMVKEYYSEYVPNEKYAVILNLLSNIYTVSTAKD